MFLTTVSARDIFCNRCEADPESRGGVGAGASGESARYDGGIPHARAPEPGNNAESGCGEDNRDGGKVRALKVEFVSESKTGGRAEQ